MANLEFEITSSEVILSKTSGMEINYSLVRNSHLTPFELSSGFTLIESIFTLNCYPISTAPWKYEEEYCGAMRNFSRRFKKLESNPTSPFNFITLILNVSDDAFNHLLKISTVDKNPSKIVMEFDEGCFVEFNDSEGNVHFGWDDMSLDVKSNILISDYQMTL